MRKIKFSLLYPLILLFMINCKEDNPIVHPTDQDVILENVSYGTHERNKMDIQLPSGRNSSKTKILVLIHGGGWIGGDKSDFDVLLNTANLENLKKEFPDIAVFTLNYRLATTNANQYPAAEQDIKKAMEFIFGNADSYQVNANAIYLAESAGAHLAALYTTKNPSPRLKGTIGISGAYALNSLYADGNNEAKEVLQTFLGGTPQNQEQKYYDASPVNFIQATTIKYLLLHGRDDRLTPISQAEKFETALKSKNVDVQKFYYSGGHGIPPEHLLEGLQRIQNFLK